MTMKLLLTGSAMALGVALTIATPASAQFVCDQDAAGESGAGATATGPASLACGTNSDAGSAGTNFATAVGVEANATNEGATAIGSFANWPSPLGPVTPGIQSIAIGSTARKSSAATAASTRAPPNPKQRGKPSIRLGRSQR